VPRPSGHCVTVNGYMYRWDSDDADEDTAIFDVWENRAWLAWLKQHLRLPFRAQRMEEEQGWLQDDADEQRGIAAKTASPFSLGSIVTVTGLSMINDDIAPDFEGVVVDAECQGEQGVVALQDLEVVPPDDPNYGPVREWVVHYPRDLSPTWGSPVARLSSAMALQVRVLQHGAGNEERAI